MSESHDILPADDEVEWPFLKMEPERQEAVYRKTGVDYYDKEPNPLIMALPPIMDDVSAIRAMTKVVAATVAQRAKPRHLRLHEVGAIDTFFQPLDDHVDFFHQISRMLRAGYVNRNPVIRSYVKMIKDVVKELDRLAAGGDSPVLAKSYKVIAISLTLLGLSGVGKSWAVQAVIGTYPQLIHHSRLPGPFQSMVQVVYIYIICPEDASQKGLLMEVIAAFDRLLGTDYYRMYVTRSATIHSLRAAVARLAFLHGLGMLIIDEVQHLNNAKAGGAQIMIDFFKIFSEIVMVPLLLIGTEEAEDMLSGTFQAARRHSGLPLFRPMPLLTLVESGKPELNRSYKLFYDSMFRAQYVQQPIKADGQLLKQLHYMTQGIRGIDVKLFSLTQLRALSIGAEQLTVELFRSVYEDCFKPLHKLIGQMRGSSTAVPPEWSAAYDKFMKDKSVDDRATVPGNAPPMVKTSKAGRQADASEPGSTQPSGPDAEPWPDHQSRSGLVLTELLVRGVENGISGYDSLKAAGFIRNVGAELLRGG